MLAAHVPKTASDEGVVAAAKKALGDALIEVVAKLLELLLVDLARDQVGQPRQLLLGRHGVVLGVEHHSHSSAPFFHA